MRSGTTRAKATPCYFQPTMHAAVGVEDRSSAENASADCSSTTSVPHEFFVHTGTMGGFRVSASH